MRRAKRNQQRNVIREVSQPVTSGRRSCLRCGVGDVRTRRVVVCVTAMLVPLVAITQTAPPAQPFQRLDGCVYKSRQWNDGDSFHIILPDRKEVIFRLYFVDTPEEERALDH